MRKPAALVSIGYGGRKPSELIATLLTAGVELLVDVRLSPRSAIPGFSGSALRNALAAAGIVYRHEAALGNPSENRDDYRIGAPAARERFGDVLRTSGRGSIEWLANAASRQRVAVLCAERDDSRCHRQQITAAAMEINPRVLFIRLG